MFGNKAWTNSKEKCSKGQTGSGPNGWRIAKTGSNNKSAKPCTKRIAEIEKIDMTVEDRLAPTAVLLYLWQATGRGHAGTRHQWSVAFPVVESYDIIGHPDAKRVFGEIEFKSLFQCTRAGLREVTDRQRELIAELEKTTKKKILAINRVSEE